MPEDVLAAVAKEESGDQPIGEPPLATDAFEPVDVPTGGNRLQRKRVRLLEHRRVAARGRAVAVELDDHVADDVLRAWRAVGVQARAGEELPYLCRAAKRHDFRPGSGLQ